MGAPLHLGLAVWGHRGWLGGFLPELSIDGSPGRLRPEFDDYIVKEKAGFVDCDSALFPLWF